MSHNRYQVWPSLLLEEYAATQERLSIVTREDVA
jgi:hypothetical protein